MMAYSNNKTEDQSTFYITYNKEKKNMIMTKMKNVNSHFQIWNNFSIFTVSFSKWINKPILFYLLFWGKPLKT